MWRSCIHLILPHIVRLDPDENALGEETVERLDAVMQAFLALEDICSVQKRAAIPLCLKLPATEAGLERLVTRVRGLLGVGDAVIVHRSCRRSVRRVPNRHHEVAI